jgi:AcrR family transcriptional regulator
MPKVLPEYLELRRQQIVNAAAACFARRGFHQTTMQDICVEAELSPGAVYRYFRSKEEIIEGMSEHIQARNAGLLEQSMSKGLTLEVFDELIRVFFLEMEESEMLTTCALMLELISESSRNESIRQSQDRIQTGVRESLRDIIAKSQEMGDVEPSLDPEGVARVMVALYQGFITQKLVNPDLNVQAYADAACALFGGRFWTGDRDLCVPANGNAVLQH